MEERKSESKKGRVIPQGVEILLDLGHDIQIAKVDIKIIREQDKNAHYMKPEMFRQLAENIKKRGIPESLPFCVLTDKVEIVSGHHRLRASKEAGLKEIYVMLDVSGLTRSQIAAKQLAHNSLVGDDDPSMLKEIAKMITDVDDMIESFIGKDILGEPLAELEKLLSPKVEFDWKQIQFVFLPHQLKNLELFVEKTGGSFDFVGTAHVDQYGKLMDSLQKYQNFKNVKNLGTAINAMIEAANNEMKDAEYDGSEEWMTLSNLFGSAAVPSRLHSKMKEVFEKMKKDGVITDKMKWKALDILAETYLNS